MFLHNKYVTFKIIEETQKFRGISNVLVKINFIFIIDSSHNFIPL
jgi:putative flippase GtrA